jgi:hypothetical protein
MFNAFEFLIILPFFYIISYIIRKILVNIRSQPARSFIMILAFVGVFIHEVCHAITCLLMGIRPNHFSVHFYDRYTGEVSPHGMVSHETHHLSFLQNFMISIAPLVISSWLFFWSLGILLYEDIDMLTYFFHLFFCISLLIGATPSYQDFRSAWDVFKLDPRYSLYQIFLLVVAGFLVWYLLDFYQIFLSIDIIYYILVALMYVIMKYSFRGLGVLYYLIARKRRDPYFYPKMNYRRYTRRRFRPLKPRKLRFEEWE